MGVKAGCSAGPDKKAGLLWVSSVSTEALFLASLPMAAPKNPGGGVAVEPERTLLGGRVDCGCRCRAAVGFAAVRYVENGVSWRGTRVSLATNAWNAETLTGN